MQEWAAEIRRRYVEPKTRAMLREEGATTPRKRKRRLFGAPDPRPRNAAAPDTGTDAALESAPDV